eukprot:TRINITY_DN5354_c0_g1_i3.p1 TRINITY_DN5354_c0_g1~~TRINITY_DN5354_c0_g1_i3.p1  ORF type:complete len:1124 (+),score=289.25 TRINITY_DN5354_c0_g1_i3:74-3373(+)
MLATALAAAAAAASPAATVGACDVAALAAALSAAGGGLHPRVTIACCGPAGDLVLRATEDIPAGEPLVAVPQSWALTAAGGPLPLRPGSPVPDEQRFGGEGRLRIAAELLRSRDRGATSPLAEWLRCLPRDCRSLICASPAPAADAASAGVAEKQDKSAAEAAVAHSAIDWGAAGFAEPPQLPDWLWALGVVLARAVDMGSAEWYRRSIAARRYILPPRPGGGLLLTTDRLAQQGVDFEPPFSPLFRRAPGGDLRLAESPLQRLRRQLRAQQRDYSAALRGSMAPPHMVLQAGWELLPRYTRRGFARRSLPPQLRKRLRWVWAQHRANASSRPRIDSDAVLDAAPPGAREGPPERLLDLALFDPRLLLELERTVQRLLEDWVPSAAPLAHTMSYGMREYRRWSSLVAHVDRYRTHALSAIVHISQEVMEAPWPLEVFPFDSEAPELLTFPAQPGAENAHFHDVILYESSTLVHGRPLPLRGDSYVNIFVHYAPRSWEAAVAALKSKGGGEIRPVLLPVLDMALPAPAGAVAPRLSRWLPPGGLAAETPLQAPPGCEVFAALLHAPRSLHRALAGVSYSALRGQLALFERANSPGALPRALGRFRTAAPAVAHNAWLREGLPSEELVEGLALLLAALAGAGGAVLVVETGRGVLAALLLPRLRRKGLRAAAVDGAGAENAWPPPAALRVGREQLPATAVRAAEGARRGGRQPPVWFCACLAPTAEMQVLEALRGGAAAALALYGPSDDGLCHSAEFARAAASAVGRPPTRLRPLSVSAWDTALRDPHGAPSGTLEVFAPQGSAAADAADHAAEAFGAERLWAGPAPPWQREGPAQTARLVRHGVEAGLLPPRTPAGLDLQNVAEDDAAAAVQTLGDLLEAREREQADTWTAAAAAPILAGSPLPSSVHGGEGLKDLLVLHGAVSSHPAHAWVGVNVAIPVPPPPGDGYALSLLQGAQLDADSLGGRLRLAIRVPVWPTAETVAEYRALAVVLQSSLLPPGQWTAVLKDAAERGPAALSAADASESAVVHAAEMIARTPGRRNPPPPPDGQRSGGPLGEAARRHREVAAHVLAAFPRRMRLFIRGGPKALAAGQVLLVPVP